MNIYIYIDINKKSLRYMTIYLQTIYMEIINYTAIREMKCYRYIQ